MCRTIVTIHAVHLPPASVRDLFGGQRAITIEILSHVATAILDPDPWNHLPAIIDRNISNFVRDVHVPVNAGHQSRLRTAAADVYQHAALPQSVVFVIAVPIENFELCSEKLFRPVTLFASLLRGPQIVHRRSDRPGVLLECDGIKLICARKLGAHIPTRAWSDVTTNATYARVCAREIGRVLRLHYCVAGSAAEAHRLRILEA